MENWKKQHFICSYLTLFIVPFFLFFFFPFSFFLSFISFISFFFFLEGDGPQPPQMTPLVRTDQKHRVTHRIFMESTLSIPQIGRARSASFALGLHTYLLTYLLSRDVRRVLKEFSNWILLLLHPMVSCPSGLVVSVLRISLSIATRITSHRSISHHSVISSIHLLGGLPLSLHPSTMPNATIFNTLSSFILATCPNSLSFLDFIMSITVDFLPIIVRTSSFVIWSHHLISKSHL